jgi:cytochrome c oxidase subunit 2
MKGRWPLRPLAGVWAAAVVVSTLACAGAQDRTDLAQRGERLFTVQGCYGCHLVGKYGTPIGPDLSHVGFKYGEGYLRRWLRDPQEQRPTAHMPKLELEPTEIDALAAFLASLK